LKKKRNSLKTTKFGSMWITIIFYLGSVWLLSQDRRDEDDRDRGDKKKKGDGDKIIFSSDVQDKMIIYVFYLVKVDKT